MLDTLMVLWTRGVCARFARSLLLFVALFVSICLLLFLVTNSDVRWPGLAFTASFETNSGSASASDLPVPTPTTVGFSIPVILQNPTVTPIPTQLVATPLRPVATPRALATVPAKHKPTPSRQNEPSAKPRPTPPQEMFPKPELPELPPNNGWFSDAIAANGHLAGGLIDSSELENLFWYALLATLLIIGSCIVLFLIIRRKRRLQP